MPDIIKTTESTGPAPAVSAAATSATKTDVQDQQPQPTVKTPPVASVAPSFATPARAPEEVTESNYLDFEATTESDYALFDVTPEPEPETPSKSKPKKDKESGSGDMRSHISVLAVLIACYLLL